MWVVKARAPVSEVYEALRDEFRLNVAKREKYEFEGKVIGRDESNRPKALPTTFEKERYVSNEEEDRKSLLFRHALKSVQSILPALSGEVEVDIRGSGNKLSITVKEVTRDA